MNVVCTSFSFLSKQTICHHGHSKLNESVLDWNMMLKRSAIKRLIFDVIGTSSWASANLSIAAGMPVRCLRVSKVTCWLFFYLIEIAWDQGNEPLWCSRKGRIY